MSWLDSIINSDTAKGIGNWLGSKQGAQATDALFNLGLSAGAEFLGLNDPQIQKTGYLGEIPKYDAVRERVPNTYDPTRRPGSSGQRYFTDTRFVPRGSQPAPLSAAGLAALNLNNPARQTRPVAPVVTPTPVPTNLISPPTTLAHGGIARNRTVNRAKGGIAELRRGRYLDGPTSGMADEVHANIEGTQEARLSDGEFVVPADVVSHLGNGNSDAGAAELYDMMDRVRKARTGTTKQAKEIDPKEFLPV